MTDAENNVTAYRHDRAGCLHSVVQPGGATVQYDYDAHGNLSDKRIGKHTGPDTYALAVGGMRRINGQRHAVTDKYFIEEMG